MKKFFVCVCTFLFVLMAVSGTGQAALLGDLFGGANMTVGDKVFSNWTLIDFNDSANPGNTNYNLIEVNPLADQPLNPGLEFVSTGLLTVSDLDIMDLYFSFTVTSLGALIKDNSLEITDYDFGAGNWGGLIYIEEHVYDVADNPLAYKEAQIDNLFGIVDPYDEAEFAPQQSIKVEKNILLSGDWYGDTVSLNSFDQRFSQVPEPATILLVSTGLLGIGALRKRRKAKLNNYERKSV